MDPGMSQLLKWSIENSEAASSDPNSSTDPRSTQPSRRPLNSDALNSLFGGPSDAELMKQSMAAILSPEVTLENKLVAFDNFEQLIEQVDNANNIDNLGLWTQLKDLLSSEEADLRRFACWCIGTAVQNNLNCQERPVTLGILPLLTKLAIEDPSEMVRRKAIYAISSEVRNYQPALDAAVESLPKNIVPEGGTDAGDMDAIDHITGKLREESARKAAA